jgi:hypothetical protein
MEVERRARDSAPTRYRPRRPSQSVLYRCVQEHLETWLALAGEGDGDPVPAHVEREFRRYLECGILAHGFARARCGQCGHDFLIAFSCTPRVLPSGRKGRGVCPSCAAKQIPLRDNTRRMVATAAHLTDHVLPPLPVRQWVLAVPKRLRYFLPWPATLGKAARRAARDRSPGPAGTVLRVRSARRLVVNPRPSVVLARRRAGSRLRPSCTTGAHVGRREPPAQRGKTPHRDAQLLQSLRRPARINP